MKFLSVPIPKTRDPFCNTPPIPIGTDAHGSQRFWITTYNANVGCTGLVLDERGNDRLYRLGTRAGGYYSAAAENQDVLWLCGVTSFVLRLDLRTGKHIPYETGLPKGLVFYGMALDAEAGKLFVLAKYNYDSLAFAFDIRKRRVAQVFRGLRGTRGQTSFKNTDGSWTILTDKSTAVRWVPEQNTVSETVYKAPVRDHEYGFISPPIRDDSGRAYLPGRGWLDSDSMKIYRSGPKPEREAIWIGRRGTKAWGVCMRSEDIDVLRWDMTSGKVGHLCTVRDCHLCCLALTDSGHVIAVNMFGFFTRHHGDNGMLECSRKFPVEAVGRVDCIQRIDKQRVLGTPYITQRFWEVDLETGAGIDCGRAAPGVGEVLRTCRIRNKIYMAVYTGGELVEYDPKLPARFPENPRVVATPPHSMRPVAMVNDGRMIWYACNKPYGSLGCVLTRYDARTGAYDFADDALPGQQIRGMWHDTRSAALYSGSTIHADQHKAMPDADRAVFASFDPHTLKVLSTVSAPERVTHTLVAGPLDRNRLLVVGIDDQRQRQWGVLNINPLRAPSANEWFALPVPALPVYAGRPGMFVLPDDDKVDLWNMNTVQSVATLYKRPARKPPAYQCFVQDGDLMLVLQKELVVVRDIFKSVGRHSVAGT